MRKYPTLCIFGCIQVVFANILSVSKFKRYAIIYPDPLIHNGATLVLKLILWLVDFDY